MWCPTPNIYFDKPDKTYLPGETVSGTVLFGLSSYDCTNKPSLNARSVTIRLRGTTETWKINYCESACKKVLFNQSHIAWLSKDGVNQFPNGKQEFHFETMLPKECPPTFKGSNGQNKYTVDVIVDVPWSWTRTFEMEFTVNRKLEMVPLSNFRMCTWKLRHDFQSGFLFNDGPISVKMTVHPKFIFLPGDIIRANIQIDNNSATQVVKVSAGLGRSVHYHSRHQNTPCITFTNNSCPLSRSCQLYSGGTIGRLGYHDGVVEPYSTKMVSIDVPVPMDCTTPSFASGLMTLGYYLEVGIRTKMSFWQYMYMKVYIGEKPGEKKEEMKNLAPPAYSLVNESD